MNDWPTEKDLNDVINQLDPEEKTHTLSPEASELDKLKYAMCQQFIKYLTDNNLDVEQLAEKAEMKPALMSKIIHCHLEYYTLEQLLEYYLRVDRYAKFKIDII